MISLILRTWSVFFLLINLQSLCLLLCGLGKLSWIFSLQTPSFLSAFFSAITIYVQTLKLQEIYSTLASCKFRSANSSGHVDGCPQSVRNVLTLPKKTLTDLRYLLNLLYVVKKAFTKGTINKFSSALIYFNEEHIEYSNCYFFT